MEVEPSGPTRAPQACLACRKQKRRCDKALPSCSLCVRMCRTCDYSDTNSSPGSEDFAMLRQKLADLEARLDGRRSGFGWYEPIRSINRGSTENSNGFTCGNSSFPSAAFFLDAEVFEQAGMTIPRPSLAIPTEVMATLGISIRDIRDIVDRYFANIHTWLPFVSKRRLDLALSNPSLDLSADCALLLLAMKLIIQAPSGDPESMRSPLYALTKQNYAMVESEGLISLQTLQANILIAVFEIGHAIYPAAYMTTGQCARLGHVLGINDRNHAHQYFRRPPVSWAEVEEEKRTWWATMLLDRYVNLGGGDHMPLATEDASRSDVLPADDEKWDAGEVTTSEPLYVSSPTNVKTAPFARTCQATHLLGKMFRLLNDQLSDAPLRFTEAMHLCRTLQALARLLQADFQQSPMRYGTAFALCHGALLHLCDPFSCTESNRGDHPVEETEMQTLAIAAGKATVTEILGFSQLLMDCMVANPAAISPFLGDCLYSTAGTYAWLAYESGLVEMGDSYRKIRKLLETMNTRWAVAGYYLGLLDEAKEKLYPNCLLL
ncbi:hypothetical protein ABEF95_015225 [Exophiala dermatitidis]